MSKIHELCNLDYIHSVIREGEDIDTIVESLVLKADEEAPNVESLEELEGEAVHDGDLRILEKCPMKPVLDDIKKENLAKTGKEELPAFFQEIVDRFIKQHPNEGSLLHPLCIVHQAMRDIIGSKEGYINRQVTCRSSDTGKVVFAKNGLSLANLTEDEARAKIEGKACIYLQKKL